MAELIRVDYEALANIADRFGQEAEAIEQMLQMMRRSMAPLQNGGWVGRGSDAFFAEMESDMLPAVRRLADALDQAGAVSRQIGEVMQGAEEEAGSPFRADSSGGAAAPGAGGSGGAAGGGGTAPGGGMYVPGDWLDGVGGAADGGGILPGGFNDWGIPQNWLDGVAGAMGVGGGGSNWGIPDDWLDGVTDAFNGDGAVAGGANGAAAGSSGGGAAGGAGSDSAAGSTEPSQMPTGGGSGSGKAATAADIGSPYGRQTAVSGSSTLFGGGQVVAEAQNGRLSYQSLGGGGFAAASGGSTPYAAVSGGGAGAAAPAAASSSAGIGLAIAALTPMLGIMGKAAKDALEK
jgi:WXG100 family type VII secretion target